MVKNDAKTIVVRSEEDRREFCQQHHGEQMQSKVNCANIEKIELGCVHQKEKCEILMNAKTPLWAFKWAMGFIVVTIITILGVQWKTYLQIGELQSSIVNRIIILEERQNVVYRTLGLWFKDH